MKKIVSLLLSIIAICMFCACKPNPNDGKCDRCGVVKGFATYVSHYGENNERELCTNCAIEEGYFNHILG